MDFCGLKEEKDIMIEGDGKWEMGNGKREKGRDVCLLMSLEESSRRLSIYLFIRLGLRPPLCLKSL